MVPLVAILSWEEEEWGGLASPWMLEGSCTQSSDASSEHSFMLQSKSIISLGAHKCPIDDCFSHLMVLRTQRVIYLFRVSSTTYCKVSHLGQLTWCNFRTAPLSHHSWNKSMSLCISFAGPGQPQKLQFVSYQNSSFIRVLLLLELF